MHQSWALASTVLLCTIELVNGHGFMLLPHQRGTLAGNRFVSVPIISEKAPFDHKPHFPAGDKRSIPGAGLRSQKRASGFNYTTFQPLQPGFRWRAGVCGDLKSDARRESHLKGEKFYFNGTIVKTVKSGGTLHVKFLTVFHHKGYLVFHVCNVHKTFCPSGDITSKCFTRNNCYELQRKASATCESGYSTKCGPIDRRNKARWYLPCKSKKPYDLYGNNLELAFRIPGVLKCQHCVLHWAWITSKRCHADGVTEYFGGPDSPKAWENCPGNENGGFYAHRKRCGGPNYPEEYYGCPDIRIN